LRLSLFFKNDLDGIEDDAHKKQCMLVLIGATADGRQERIAILDGYRESEQSWSELLLGLKHRGLAMTPKVAVGDILRW
jgi:putative transposase